MNLSPRNKLILIAAVCVVVVVGLGGLLLVPSYNEIKSLSSQMDQAVQEYVSAKTLLEQRQTVKSEAAQTDAKLIELAVAVPENPDLPSLIIDLEDTAYSSGVVLRTVRPSDPVVPEGERAFAGLPVEMEVWGSWADAIDFVDRLEKLPRQLRVNSFDVTVLSAPQEAEKASYGLSFPPYYQVKCTVKVTAYVIPSGSTPTSSSAVPAAQ